MLDKGKKYLDAGADVLSESWLYTYAFAEYTGLVIFSYIKRGGSAAASVIEPAAKAASPAVFTPVKEIAGAAFEKTVSGLSEGLTAASQAVQKLFVCRSKRLEALDSRLTQLEERLSYLEKHGIIATNEGLHVKGKKLTEDRLAFLRNIVNENIDLIVEDKNGEKN
ncbi:hypothetical protein [Candidatus Magnetominusculus xianensis]|uniref:Magnetosome protein Man1 n=1 Tax=Candidatus Magnetominusculus xianensis TaxID=1748249 RepID=A0ABR5SJN3_9BACT|nr:hypothetical protein [Candidatus Magnetominusculus xianensis]KWT94825.1 magnetosome protein Man1 [Candidatus Magnetominusculus xianensis]MBF0404717.1 hypothetical protein [Nitrospirota bacterium]